MKPLLSWEMSSFPLLTAPAALPECGRSEFEGKKKKTLRRRPDWCLESENFLSSAPAD